MLEGRPLEIVTNLLLASLLLAAGCSGVRPGNLGVKDGKLAPCPATPNCVSSESSDRDHSVDPIRYSGTASSAMDGLKQVLRGMKRARIVSEQDRYLHLEFRSALFRFVDDVEFFINEPLERIEIRSASRVGKSDLGVNRKRVEEIRMRWNSRERAGGRSHERTP
jgi:uncharacterized protein (DUF1499 family)